MSALTHESLLDAAVARVVARDLAVQDCASIDGEVGLLQDGWYADDGNAEVYYSQAESGAEAAHLYVDGGDWGDGHGSVEVMVWQMCYLPTGAERCNEHTISVDIPQDEAAMIRTAVGTHHMDEICGDDPADHEWTSDGEGGSDENPGVWATGGTSLLIHQHCARCGLRRHTHLTGAQRNPGDGDWVEYISERA